MSEREVLETPDLTVHCLVRNEERFIRPAILSILPLAERVLVYDTGSTDATLEILASIQSEKLAIVRKTFAHPRELNGFRNEMIERTTTGWFMLVDGDEIYPSSAISRIAEELQAVPATICEIDLWRMHFVRSFNFISSRDTVGRIYRTSRIRWRTAHLPSYRLRADSPFLRENPSASVDDYSMRFPEDIFFFHCQYLVRSSNDGELGALRRWRWRKPPLPVLPYFGPWPETLAVDGVADRMTPRIFAAWVGLNAHSAGIWGLTLARKLLKAEQATWHPPS